VNDDTEAIAEVLDKVLGPLPIYATRIGYRHDSTDYERRLGEFLFQIAREWDEFKESERVPASTTGSDQP
jgi:hypothetical protein